MKVMIPIIVDSTEADLMVRSGLQGIKAGLVFITQDEISSHIENISLVRKNILDENHDIDSPEHQIAAQALKLVNEFRELL